MNSSPSKPNLNALQKHNDTELRSKLSHHKSRCFQPSMLKKPREFETPRFIKHYDNSRPLILEIGAGKGKHAYAYAQQNPSHDIIAVERTANKFNAFESLLAKTNINSNQRINNLLAIHADAIPYCVHALPPESIDNIYILYPNPEPKNPNQQWLNMPFFEFLLSRLKPCGKVILATNIEDYIANAFQESVHTWCLKTRKYEVPQESKRTHFEIKYLARGETCWEIEMIKPSGYKTRFDDWHSTTLYHLND